jgi:hypothetical protein
MKKFSELGIKPTENKAIFEVPKLSIEDLINCEVEVIDFESGVTTRHGEGRTIVKVKYNGAEVKFFTNAKPIKEALQQVQKQDFPFLATIKVQKYGSGSAKTYYFL